MAVGLQWGRGLKTPEIRSRCAMKDECASFNGAGVLRPRKSMCDDGKTHAQIASMGPGS